MVKMCNFALQMIKVPVNIQFALMFLFSDGNWTQIHIHMKHLLYHWVISLVFRCLLLLFLKLTQHCSSYALNIVLRRDPPIFWGAIDGARDHLWIRVDYMQVQGQYLTSCTVFLVQFLCFFLNMVLSTSCHQDLP